MNSFSDHSIPTNFTIPKRLRKKRYIFKSHKAAMEISVCGRRKIRLRQSGSFGHRLDSMILDWIQDTIEELRLEAGGL